MAKFQSPLLGYNNNVRHKNRVFHIQTEDSGVNHPHIITHLFMDGGRILKSVKKSYAEHVGAEGMQEIVRGLMKEQHKAIFIALRDGQFDALVDAGRSGSSGSIRPPAMPAPAATANTVLAVPAAGPVQSRPREDAGPVRAPPAPVATPKSEAAVAAALPDVPTTHPAPTEPAPASADALPTIDGPPSVEAPPATVQDSPRPMTVPPSSAAHAKSDTPPATMRQVPDASVAGRQSALLLDLDALEQATHDGDAGRSLFRADDLPPPPKNLFAKEPGTGGAYRAVEDLAAVRSDSREEPEGATGKPQPRTGGARIPGAPATAEARYAPARPAAIFGSTHRPPPASLFSDDLVSDKSLDEVILSYLAEDLEPPRRA